jgi:hypothetical protein
VAHSDHGPLGCLTIPGGFDLKMFMKHEGTTNWSNGSTASARRSSGRHR